MYTLRSYQKEAVDKAIGHFKRSKKAAVLVLPTGAGKSLVIAELARIARGRVLVLAHVKELVEQNHAKYESFGLKAGIFSAGLSRKDYKGNVIFGSIQSVARAKSEFLADFSLLIVDECHRISLEKDSQYQSVITQLKRHNPKLCVLGLTATPYRLGLGWIYEYHDQAKERRSEQEKFFKHCIYEVSIAFMIEQGYLTPPVLVDAPVACYDFSKLTEHNNHGGGFKTADIERMIFEQKRITPGIVQHIASVAADRKGVMIFTSSVDHAKEIYELLLAITGEDKAAIVVGDTDGHKRDQIIHEFKEQRIKFLVNVSVLTTGFDAPHVDLIAILRPTESVALFQQIVGRGLRLSPGKKDCLVLDYTGMGHDLFAPEIEDPKPNEHSQLVDIDCPVCGHTNQFWGIADDDGYVVEHYGRRCKAIRVDPESDRIEQCDYRFRFKVCDDCGAENDIAARKCNRCMKALIDDDQRLKNAMSLKDAHIMRPDTMLFERSYDRKKKPRLSVCYYDFDAEVLKEHYYFDSPSQQKAFYYNFMRMHLKRPEQTPNIEGIEDAIAHQELFRMPRFVIARHKKYFWQIREKIF
jgi:DNA repair protein RadD